MMECASCRMEFEYTPKRSGGAQRKLCDPCRVATRQASYRKWRANHKDLANERNREYYAENREVVLVKGREWRKEHIEKERVRKRKYRASREDPRKTDPGLNLRHNISCSVRNALRKTGGTKQGSILGALPYTIDDLKCHLEGQFEPWMSWGNWGKYNPDTWDDNDADTWTWQIDHIVPQSELPYESMDDPNFAICWSLDNLRPLSSKKNNMDGVKRTRHAYGV